MKTQKEFVEEALAFNRENGFVSVNGAAAYEDAHYPRPKGDGEETKPLTHGQHQIQGLLQSEEEGQCCFFPGDAKRFLYGEGFLCPDWFELVDLYERWMFDLTSRSGGGDACRDRRRGVHDPKNKVKCLEGNVRGGTTCAQQHWISLIDGFISSAANISRRNQILGGDGTERVLLEGTDAATLLRIGCGRWKRVGTHLRAGYAEGSIK